MAGIEWRKYYISMINDQIFRILKQDKKIVVGRSTGAYTIYINHLLSTYTKFQKLKAISREFQNFNFSRV